MQKRLFLIAGLLGLATNVAFAASQTQTFDVPAQVIAGPSTTSILIPAYSLLMPFDQFDSNIGTLNSVQWSYSLTFEFDAVVSDGGGGYGGGVGGDFYVGTARELGLESFSSNGNGTGAGGPSSGPFTLEVVLSNTETLNTGTPGFEGFSSPGGGNVRNRVLH